MYTSSPNHRPGEPLRSWLESTPVREHDARSVLRFSAADGSVRKLIEGEALNTDDLLSFGRLNSYCVSQWYEPVVELMNDPFIKPPVADFFRMVVTEG